LNEFRKHQQAPDRRKGAVGLTHIAFAAGLPAGFRYRHAYYDHSQLTSGPRGRVLVRDREAKPVVIAAELGQGRVCFSGCLTYDRDDHELTAPLTGPEQMVLVQALRWLARGQAPDILAGAARPSTGKRAGPRGRRPSSSRAERTTTTMSQPVTVGAHPWVYAATQPNYDISPILDHIFGDMSAAGLDAIELMHGVFRDDEAVDHIRELAEKHGLPVVGSSFGGCFWTREGQAEVIADARLIVPRLAEVGGRTLGTSVGRSPEPKTKAEFDVQAETLKEVIAICEACGVVLNLHNHTYEVENNLHDLGGTLERVPDVKLGPDLNWCLRGGIDPLAFIKRFGSQIVFLHLRDQYTDGRWSESLGEGDMDYAAIGLALREVGFKGDAVIELAHEGGFELTRPLRKSLAMSRRCVRQTLGY